MIANHEHAINSCMLCLPSLAGIWTRIAHSKQFSRRQKKSDALDRSAAMTGLYVCLFVCLCFLSSYFYLSSISPSLCISSFLHYLSLFSYIISLSLSLSLSLFIYFFTPSSVPLSFHSPGMWNVEYVVICSEKHVERNNMKIPVKRVANRNMCLNVWHP